MCSDAIAVQVEKLGKCYRIYENQKDRIKQTVLPLFHPLLGREAKHYYQEFWSLKNVSFEVAHGETIGIIGSNGSGKSTLLQMICGTLEPTTGSVDIDGRIAALLELGAGFNPDFTGRENVYMNATVLGLTQDEIDSRFDEIAAFADIGVFMEQPVKHYSSGMYARLAFAVAINVDPVILIVDEALAVGDELFQRKCFAKIEEIKRNGGTILIVSHASNAVVSLCDRVLLLNKGEQIFIGEAKLAVSHYQKIANKAPVQAESGTEKMPSNNPAESAENDTIKTAEVGINDDYWDKDLNPVSTIYYEANGAEISNQRIETLAGKKVNVLVKGLRYQICFDAHFTIETSYVRFNSIIKTIKGVELGGGTYPEVMESGISVTKGQQIQVLIEFDCKLRPDTYFFNCGIASNQSLLHRIIDAGVFRVISENSDSAIGVVDFGCSSSISMNQPVSEQEIL